MTTEELNKLSTLLHEWEQIALRCDAIAARHRAKGERLQAIEQAAFATGRRACASQLRATIEGAKAT